MSAEHIAKPIEHPYSVAVRYTNPTGEITYQMAVNGIPTRLRVPELVGETILASPVGTPAEAAPYEHYERVLYQKLPPTMRRRVFVARLISDAQEAVRGFGPEIRTRQGVPRKGGEAAVPYGLYIDQSDLQVSGVAELPPALKQSTEADTLPLVESIDGKRVIYFDKREKDTVIDVVVNGHVQSKLFENDEKANEKTLVDYILETGEGLTHKAIETEARIPDSTAQFVDQFTVVRGKLGIFTGDRTSLFTTHGGHTKHTYSLNAIVVPRHEKFHTIDEPEQEPDPTQPTYYVQIGEHRTEVAVLNNGALRKWIFNNFSDRYAKSIADFYFLHHNLHTSGEQMESWIMQGSAPAEAIDVETRIKVRDHLRKMNGGTPIFESTNRRERSTHRMTANVVFGPPPDDISEIAAAATIPEEAHSTPEGEVELVESIDGKRAIYFQRTTNGITVKVRKGNDVHVAHYIDEKTIKSRTIVDYMLANPHFIDMVVLTDLATIPGLEAGVYDQISRIRKRLDALIKDEESVFSRQGVTKEKSYKMNTVVIDLDPPTTEPAESTPQYETNTEWPTYYVRRRNDVTYVTVVNNGTAETRKFVNTEIAKRRDMVEVILTTPPGEPLTKAIVEEKVGVTPDDQTDNFRADLTKVRTELIQLNNGVSAFTVKRAGANSEFTFHANVVYGAPPAELFLNVSSDTSETQTTASPAKAAPAEKQETQKPRPMYYVEIGETETRISTVQRGGKHIETRSFINTELAHYKEIADYILLQHERLHPGERLTSQLVQEYAGNPDPTKRFDVQLSYIKTRMAQISNGRAPFLTEKRGTRSSFALDADIIYGPPPAIEPESIRFQLPDGAIVATINEGVAKLLAALAGGPLPRGELIKKINVRAAQFETILGEACAFVQAQPFDVQITTGFPEVYTLIDRNSGEQQTLTRLVVAEEDDELFTTRFIPDKADRLPVVDIFTLSTWREQAEADKQRPVMRLNLGNQKLTIGENNEHVKELPDTTKALMIYFKEHPDERIEKHVLEKVLVDMGVDKPYVGSTMRSVIDYLKQLDLLDEYFELELRNRTHYDEVTAYTFKGRLEVRFGTFGASDSEQPSSITLFTPARSSTGGEYADRTRERNPRTDPWNTVRNREDYEGADFVIGTGAEPIHISDPRLASVLDEFVGTTRGLAIGPLSSRLGQNSDEVIAVMEQGSPELQAHGFHFRWRPASGGWGLYDRNGRPVKVAFKNNDH